jgi:uncharacterized protein YeaO (DUF488 family)
VRLGSPRTAGEGVRLGTVRRPPRGVPKNEYSSRDYFDLWLPDLAPSADLLTWVGAEPLTADRWRAFERRYLREMQAPAARRLIALLALFSRSTSLAIGCYCEDEARCHRSLLRDLLARAGAVMAASSAARSA